MAFLHNQRLLLTAYFLFGLGSPMVSTFSGTYVWRLFHSPQAVAIFIALFCLGLPVGFFLNGMLLRNLPLKKLFFYSCFLQGSIPLLLVSLPHPTLLSVLMIGVILGVASGCFWANRNYLTSQTTTNGQRFGFISVESTITTFAAIIAPLAIGWTIAVGEHTTFYSVQTGYMITSFLGFLLLLLCGKIITGVSIPDPEVKELRVKHHSDIWQEWRWLEIVNGAVDGAQRIFPLMIVLFFLGQEESVGTVQSISSILSALMIYFAGKRATAEKDHVRLLLFWAAMTIGGSIVFASLFSPRGAIIFLAIGALVASFRWGSFAAILYDIIDAEEKRHGKKNRYALLTDRETFLNLGRALALGLFALTYTFAPTETMRFGLLFVGAAQLLLIAMTAHIEKRSR
jgi:MFS transporter, YQGE family, putative transporter